MKTTAKNIMGAIGRSPLVSEMIHRASAKRILRLLPGSHLLYGNGWDRLHPFDRLHGTDTSGIVLAKELPAHEAARDHAICYAGSQPSILRHALSTLPDIASSCFLDLGCGKGRALLVASELPFASIVGVELSPALAEIARRNANHLALRYPSRPAVRIVEADAGSFPLPAGNLVVYLYHPFGPEVMEKVVAAVEAALSAPGRVVHVIYYNPVAGQCFDNSPYLHRHFAGMLPYAAEELGYGPDQEDLVIIWQGGATTTPAAPVKARILLDPDGVRARLSEEDPPELRGR